MIIVIPILLFMTGILLKKSHALRRPAQVQWKYFEEVSLMLIIPLAGELFASFFLTKRDYVLLASIVMVLFATIGAVNRFRSRQSENPDHIPENDSNNRGAIICLSAAMAMLWAIILIVQYEYNLLPEFRLPE